MITPFKKPEMQMSAMTASAYLSARTAAGSAAQATRRDVDSAPRNDSQRAEDWTSECMFDCYND